MSKLPLFLKLLGIFFCLSLSACQESSPTPFMQSDDEGIDRLLSNLEQVKTVSNSNYESFGQQVQNVQTQQAIYNQSTEELRADLLSDVKEIDRNDFYTELQTIWNVGEHQSFFKRQISYCQTKLDLAVFGMGIIRVDEVLKGNNPSVQLKDQSAFIKYIREQIQQAIASNDKNYKAIVFKGLESSSS